MRNPRTGVTKMVNWKEFVEVNPKIMQGKPVIKGTRIPVSLVLSYLAGGMTVDEILAEYPHLSREAILACIAFAHDVIEAEEVIEVGTSAG
jgi:uncharacterized protein (DUF433 family)